MDELEKQVREFLDKHEPDKAQALLLPHLQQEPVPAFVYWAMGVVHGQKGEYEQALSYMQKASNADIFYIETYEFLSSLYYITDRIGEGFQHVMQIAEAGKRITPHPANYADFLAFIGIGIALFGKDAIALPYLEEAVQLKPDEKKFIAGKCLILFALGRYTEAFEIYDQCYGIPQLPINHPIEKLWHGESLAGKTILIHADQGHGDAIMFARYIKLVREQAAKLILEVHDPLLTIMKTLEGPDMIISFKDKLVPYDYHCPIEFLPKYIKTPGLTSGAPIPYLKVNGESPVNISQEPGFKIGIVWGGSPMHHNDHNRSCPIQALLPLFEIPGTQFYSLQIGPQAWEQNRLENPELLKSVVDDIHDFAQMAAFIQQLDLVITVDTAMAHLCGALGMHAWVMLPYIPEWRWRHFPDISPWYPNLRLFKQEIPRDWSTVVTAVAKELKKLIAVKG